MLEQQQHKPHYIHMSLLQSRAVVDLIDKAEIDADAKVDLASAAAAVQWADPSHGAKVLEALAEDCALPVRKRRRGAQNYMALVEYFTEPMWDGLMNHAVSPDAKLNVMIQHLTRLGMKCPTEPSLKMMCSLWIILTTPPTALSGMDTATKIIKLKHVKTTFDQVRRRTAEPQCWCTQLPDMPAEMLRDFPVLYKQAFGDHTTPCRPKIQGEVVHSFDLSYTCRGGLKSMVAFASGAVSQSPPHSLSTMRVGMPSGGGFDCMGMAAQFIMPMMQQMQQVVANQNRMLEITYAGGSFGAGKLHSLAALEDRAARYASSQASSGVAAIEDAETPPPQMIQRRASIESVGVSDCGGSPRLVATSADAISEMMGMLSERQRDSKDAAKAKSAAAKAASKAAATAASAPTAGPVSAGAPADAAALQLVTARMAASQAKQQNQRSPAQGHAASPAGSGAVTKAATRAATKKAATRGSKVASKGRLVPDVASTVAGDEDAAADAPSDEVNQEANRSTSGGGPRGKSKRGAAELADSTAASQGAVESCRKRAGTKIEQSASGAVLSKARPKPKSAADTVKQGVTCKGKATDPKLLTTSSNDAEATSDVGGLTLGCSKCRWKAAGCGQCRNASFCGLRWNATVCA